MKFTESRLEVDLIDKIVDRVMTVVTNRDRCSVFMDISVVNAACPLKLGELLKADDLNFWHDIYGIANHLNRKTGELEGCFLPRFAY